MYPTFTVWLNVTNIVHGLFMWPELTQLSMRYRHQTAGTTQFALQSKTGKPKISARLQNLLYTAEQCIQMKNNVLLPYRNTPATKWHNTQEICFPLIQ